MSNIHSLRIVDYLQHILEAIERIKDYTSDMIELSFFNNRLVQDAVVHNLEIVGEACKNIERHCPEFLQKYPQIPLRAAYEMRNALAHGYFKIDLEIVWNTIENSLPEFEQQVKTIYDEIKSLI